MDAESFKKKLQEKAQLDPVYKDQPLSMEERLRRLEAENAALKAAQASGQRLIATPKPPPVGLAAKLAAKREEAKGSDQPDQFGNLEGRLLIDSILYQTEVGPASTPKFVLPPKKDNA